MLGIENPEQLAILIGAIGSAGAFWRFMMYKAEQAGKEMEADQKTRAEFNETLRAQVTDLVEKVDKLIYEKESLLKEIADLRSALAKSETNITHLEEMLRRRP